MTNTQLNPKNPQPYLSDLYKRLKNPSYDAGRSTPERIQAEINRVQKATGYTYREPTPATTAQPTAQTGYRAQMDDILKQLTRNVNQPFSYDPAKDPAYQAIVPRVQQDVMEQLNARGILNSSITGENMARLTADIIPQLASQAYARQQGNLSNRLQLFNTVAGLEQLEYDRTRQAELDRMATQEAEYQRQQQQLENAWTRVKQLGYVDNAASSILGIPVGTPSFEAQKAYEDRASRLQIAREGNAAAMAQTQANIQAAMARQLQSQQYEQEYGQPSVTMQDAVEMAQKDPRVAYDPSITAKEFQAIIKEYADLLGVNEQQAGTPYSYTDLYKYTE